MDVNEKENEERRIVNLRELKKKHSQYVLKIKSDVIKQCYLGKKTHKAIACEYSIDIPSENGGMEKYYISKASVDRIVSKHKNDVKKQKALSTDVLSSFKNMFMINFIEVAPKGDEKGIICNRDIMDIYNEDRKKKLSINEINNYLIQSNIKFNTPSGMNLSDYVYKKADSKASKNASIYHRLDSIIDPDKDRKTIFLCNLLHIYKDRPYFVITLKEYSDIKSPVFFMMGFSYESGENNTLHERILNILSKSTYNTEEQVFENRTDMKGGKSAWSFYLLFSEAQINSQKIKEDILDDIYSGFKDYPIFLGHRKIKNKENGAADRKKASAAYSAKSMGSKPKGVLQTQKKQAIQKVLGVDNDTYNIFTKNVFLPKEEIALLDKYCLLKNASKNQVILGFLFSYIENWNSQSGAEQNRFLLNELFQISELEAQPKKPVTTISIPADIYRTVFVEMGGYLKLQKKATLLNFRFSEKSMLAHIIKMELERIKTNGFLDYYERIVSEGRIITEKIYNELEDTEEQTDKTYIENWKLAFREKYFFPWDLYDQYYNHNYEKLISVIENNKEASEE